MAPSSGHLLVPMAMRVVRHAFKKASGFIRSTLPAESRTLNPQLPPILIRNTARHPIHPAALLRQSKSRWYSTQSGFNATVRRFTAAARSGVKFDRTLFPKSAVGNAIARSAGRAPFASTLRPNLTGGALPRTAGGYSIGAGRLGGVRHFSHTPACPAEVVNNVSAAVRAFWLSGSKARFDGYDAVTGEKRFKAVTRLQEETARKMHSLPQSAPGSFIDFHLSPTITAMGPLTGLAGFSASADSADQASINTDGLLDMLSVDFARALKDLSIILADLKRLSNLGDLQITLNAKSTIRVRFPGCDARTVERLCDEVGLQRGIIRQDEDFDAFVGSDIALLFPFAPSGATSVTSTGPDDPAGLLPEEVDWQTMMTPSPRVRNGDQKLSDCSAFSVPSSEASYSALDARMFTPHTSSEDTHHDRFTSFQSPRSGYSSMHLSEAEDEYLDAGISGSYPRSLGAGEEPVWIPRSSMTRTRAEDYEGLEGMYRFFGGA